MAIIVVLAAVAIPTFGRQLETARETGDMELIRSMYTDALTLAVLDATDGDMDAKNGNTTISGVNGVSIASGGTVTATLNSLDPKAKFSQHTAGWEYADTTVAGVSVASGGVSRSTKSMIYTFSIGSGGNVVLKSAVGS